MCALKPTRYYPFKETVEHALGNQSKIWLFGSRVDDSKRGGDVDLYVETSHACTLKEKLRLMTQIQMAIGLRKVDLMVNAAGAVHKSIYDTAKSEGVRL